MKRASKGERILLFADCCFSGALAKAAEDLSKNGYKAASLTSADARSPSTNNWTFTQTLVDVFNGRHTADRNRDGEITLSEAEKEIAAAMKYCEHQFHGASRFKMSPEFRLSNASRNAEPNVPSPFQVYEYVEVLDDNRWRPARIHDYEQQHFITRIQEYSSRRTLRVGRNKIRKYQAALPKRFERPSTILSAEEALTKAKVAGKYRNLLRKLKVEADYLHYSEFNDYGVYPATSYAGYTEIPRGYWVYVYPHWYVWAEKGE